MRASLSISLIASVLLSTGFALSANAAVEESTSSRTLARETFEWCMAREANGKIPSSLACIGGELNRTTTAIAKAEKKLLNCSDIRQSENPSKRRQINTEVIVRMLRLRNGEKSRFEALKVSAGKIGPRKTRSLQLEAALVHLVAVRSLSADVCDASRFAKLPLQ